VLYQHEEQQLVMLQIVDGDMTILETIAIEAYTGMTIGVLIEDDQASLYLEGVSVTDPHPVQHVSTTVGIFAVRQPYNRIPTLRDVHVWDHLPGDVSGTLFTAWVSELGNTVQAGPRKLAQLRASGILAALATQTIRSP